MPTYTVRAVKKRKGHSMTKSSNPTPGFLVNSLLSVDNHNDGVDFAAAGQYGAAEQAYLKALVLKHKTIGEDAVSTANTHHCLGELYTATDRLDDAERHLAIALRIRNEDKSGPKADAAFSREKLALIHEMRGDLLAAKRMRKSTGKVSCGNVDACPIQAFNRTGLRQCARCTAIFYCTPECQKADWGRHKKYCHKLESSSLSSDC